MFVAQAYHFLMNLMYLGERDSFQVGVRWEVPLISLHSARGPNTDYSGPDLTVRTLSELLINKYVIDQEDRHVRRTIGSDELHTRFQTPAIQVSEIL